MCFKLFLLYVAVTFGQDYLWTLCLPFDFFKTCIVSIQKISLVYCCLSYLELDPLSLFEAFLWTRVSEQ